MSKKWNVKIDEQMYDVEMKGANVLINGEKFKLRKYRKKTGLVHVEYEIPLGSKTALLVAKSLGGSQLVIDGKDCATGKDFIPIKLPWWSWLFVALHFINVLNGALGFLVAVVGLTATASISSNTNMNVAVRILLDLVILVLALGVVYGIAFALVLSGVVPV